MKAILIILILSYLIFGLLLFLFQRSFLYFPQSATKNILAEEIRFFNGEQKLTGWVLNKGKHKAIIYYGGNAEAIEENIGFYLKQLRGYTTYLIPYRGYGKNSGKPTEAALYDDALYIFDKLKEQHKSINIIGRSLGTGVATYIADKRPIDKLILVTPYDSIENMAKDQYPFLPMGLLVIDKFLSVERAPNISVSTLIIIAENDEIIPRKRSDNLVKNFSQDVLSTIVVEQAGHNDVMAYPEYAEAFHRFLAQ